MANSKIEWTQKVWNPVTGCNKVSSGCKNCYAEVMHRRLMKMQPKKYSRPFLDGAFPHEPSLEIPLHWRKPQLIFVNSMSDLFHKDIPHDFILKVLMVVRKCPQHIFQILTKRPERAKEFFNGFLINSQKYPGIRGEFPFPNLWLGVSVEDQQTADERIPLLLQTPAAIRFVSAEPLLGKIELISIPANLPPLPGKRDYWDWFNCLTGFGEGPNEDFSDEQYFPKIDWVVVGGESGKGARLMQPNWARWIRDDCKAAGTPFMFKQWGEYCDPDQTEYEFYDKETDREPEPGKLYKIGKKKAGRLLDGVEHNEFPKQL